jgi:hypothetical protein
LIDDTKPGHRKILAFFLVHPDYEIPSTLHVPVQEHSKVVEQLHQAFRGQLPFEICDAIATSVGMTITPAENEEFVEELMSERSRYTDDNLPHIEYVNLW